MKTRATNILVGFIVLFFAANACGAPAPSSPDVPLEPQVEPAPTEPAPTEPVASNTAEAPAASTEAPPTLEATAVPSSTVPIVTFLEPTVCRAGPGAVYEEIATTEVGPEYLVVGRNSSKDYFIILVAGNRQCWVGAQSVVQDGDFAGLPEIPPPVGAIEGKVINYNDSRPIPKAPMRLEPSGMVTETDSDGIYQFVNVPIGDLIVHLEIPDQQPVSLEITLHDGQHKKDVNLGLFLSVPNQSPPKCLTWIECVASTFEPPAKNFP